MPASAFVQSAQVLLESRQPASLVGFWRFQAGGYDQLLRIEKEWRLQGIRGVHQGTFALRLEIPQALRTGDFALMLPPVSAAVVIRFNGFPVAAKGRVSADGRFPENSSEAFTWYPIKGEYLAKHKEQLLEIQITGFRGGGGVYGNSHIYFGGIEEIRLRYNFILLLTAFVAAAIFMIGVFHFVLVADRSYRRANLYYVLLSLSMSAHIFGMNGLGYYIWDNFLFNAGLIHLLIAAFPFAMTGFTLRYFRLQMPVARRLAYTYAAVMSVFLLLLTLFPELIPLYLEVGLPFGVTLMACSLLFALYGAILGIRRGVEGASLVFSGFLVYGISVINDVVFYFADVTPVKMADFGFLVAVVCIALALAWRLRRSATEKEELRDWHREIRLAAQIQRLALPQRNLVTPRLRISTLFKPMKIIGGDFFAFQEIAPGQTGIFIADVSGHGISAALLVNTLRSLFYQQSAVARDPAELMRRMNAGLFPHLQEQFVTAAYCVVDFDREKLLLAQAGHPPVYLIRRDAEEIIRVKPPGRFFGFEPELTYECVELPLADFRRIFLYSDGIIEAGAIQGKPYSSSRLELFLRGSARLYDSALLSALENDILEQSGCAISTDDDSSCVVADILPQPA